MITLYGIKNCDAVKNARRWLDSKNIEYRFHDFRSDGLEPKLLQAWVAQLGWETLVNKRSTTWKALDSTQREAMSSQVAIDTMLAQPTLIKRPVLVTGKSITVGFSKANYTALFQHHTL